MFDLVLQLSTGGSFEAAEVVNKGGNINITTFADGSIQCGAAGLLWPYSVIKRTKVRYDSSFYHSWDK